MRVKLEQASKATMWEPTQQTIGEGRADREKPGAGARQLYNHSEPIRTTGVVSTACEEGSLRQASRRFSTPQTQSVRATSTSKRNRRAVPIPLPSRATDLPPMAARLFEGRSAARRIRRMGPPGRGSQAR